jgi:hypothetical protein
MIFANDYGTPEKLAEYLLYLDGNDTAYLIQILSPYLFFFISFYLSEHLIVDCGSYEEYLQWKKTGPTDDWVCSN